MFSDSSEEWLENVYKRLSSQAPLPNSMSPQVRKRLSQYDDFGLINHRAHFSPSSAMRNQRSSCSIKIAEFIAPKLRKSMIEKAGIPSFLDSIKKSQLEDQRFKKSLNRNILLNEKKNPNSSRSDQVATIGNNEKRKPKGKKNEINPMYFLRINEVIEKSKKLVKRSQKFDSQVQMIKRKSTGKLNKHDKLKIESSLKLIT